MGHEAICYAALLAFVSSSAGEDASNVSSSGEGNPTTAKAEEPVPEGIRLWDFLGQGATDKAE
jgi:hypothetical protein